MTESTNVEGVQMTDKASAELRLPAIGDGRWVMTEQTGCMMTQKAVLYGLPF